jgi:hypothetical protein
MVQKGVRQLRCVDVTARCGGLVKICACRYKGRLVLKAWYGKESNRSDIPFQMLRWVDVAVRCGGLVEICVCRY